jgi:hypothetical protein
MSRFSCLDDLYESDVITIEILYREWRVSMLDRLHCDGKDGQSLSPIIIHATLSVISQSGYRSLMRRALRYENTYLCLGPRLSICGLDVE